MTGQEGTDDVECLEYEVVDVYLSITSSSGVDSHIMQAVAT